MKVWIDREGKSVEGKEFISRWKQGIQQVTPYQQVKMSLFGFYIVFAGIIWGIIYSVILKQYWLTTILSGSFIISGMQFVGMMQKYIMLQMIERRIENEK